METSICAHCQKPFTPAKSWQRYCKPSCRSSNWAKHNLNRPRLPYEIPLEDALEWMRWHHEHVLNRAPISGALLDELLKMPSPFWIRHDLEQRFRKGYIHGYGAAMDHLSALCASMGINPMPIYAPMSLFHFEKLGKWRQEAYSDTVGDNARKQPPELVIEAPPETPSKLRRKNRSK